MGTYSLVDVLKTYKTMTYSYRVIVSVWSWIEQTISKVDSGMNVSLHHSYLSFLPSC